MMTIYSESLEINNNAIPAESNNVQQSALDVFFFAQENLQSQDSLHYYPIW